MLVLRPPIKASIRPKLFEVKRKGIWEGGKRWPGLVDESGM